jgi:hypothetical protein
MATLRNSIVSWNANSLNSAKHAELLALTADDPLCILLNETKHVNESDIKALPGYTAVSKRFMPRMSGLIVYVAERLSFVRRPDLELSPHVLAIECSLKGQHLVILACYHHEASDSLRSILDSARAASRSGLPFLLCGDLNASHPAWGSVLADTAGRELDTLCTDLNLTVLNSLHCFAVPTFPSSGAVIDLAITNRPALFSGLTPDDSLPLHSDHLPLRLDVTRNAVGSFGSALNHQWRYKLNSPNWPLFESSMNAFMTQLAARQAELTAGKPAQQAVDVFWNEILAVTHAIAERCLGVEQVPMQRKVHLSPGTRQKLQAFHHAFHVARRTRTPAAKEALRVARKAWLGAFQAETAAAHARRCSRLDAGGPREFWKHWARTTPRDRFPLHTIADDQGHPPASEKQALNNLASYFAKQCTANESKRPSAEEKHAEDDWRSSAPAHVPCPALDAPFDSKQVLASCSTVKANTSPGADRFHPLFLKHISQGGADALTALFNYSWRHGVVPSGWKLANIVPIYKKEGSKSDPKNYRGISLTSVVCKLFERLIDKRLRSVLDPKLSRAQAGFRSGYSTADQLYRLYAATSRAVRGRKRLPAAFLDISRAFDKCWHHGLMYKLSKLGVTGCAWAWLKAFLSQRSIRTVHGGDASEFYEISAGVPQGAVLSPLLFLVYINDLLDYCNGCECALFADDVVIWPEQTGNGAADALRRALNGASRWAEIWRLQFNVVKSKVVIFRNAKRAPDLGVFPLSGANLPQADEYNYLGVMFAHNLSWDLHAAKLVERVRRTAFAIMRVILPTAPPGPLSIRKLVLSIMAAQISYGMPVFAPDEQTRLELDGLMAMPLRNVLGLPKSAPKAVVLNECACLNTEGMFGKATMAFARRAITLPAAHPTAELWTADSHSTVHSELKRFEHRTSMKALECDNTQVTNSLLRFQLRHCWDEEDKSVPPVMLLKLEPGLPAYLVHDNKTTAARRARLRFDRTGLNASLFHRRLAASPDCPECKGQAETADHVIMQCPKYNAARLLCDGRLRQLGLQHETHWALGGVEGELERRARRVLETTAEFLAEIDRLWH